MNVFKQPIFIVFAIVALVVAIVWNVIDSKVKSNAQKAKDAQTQSQTSAEETPKIANLTNADPVDFNSVLNNQLETANKKSLENNPLNKLAALEVEIGPTLQADDVQLRYIYNAGSASKDNWIFTISQSTGNYIRSAIPKEDYLGNIAQMNLSLWKFNYVTALQLAEKNGGMDWRDSNKDLTGIKLTLKHSGAKNWLLWIIEYSTASSNLSIQIDANSGQKVTE